MKTENDFLTLSSAARRSRWTQKIGFGAVTALSWLTVLPIVALVIYIIIEGGPQISWGFLTQMPSDGMRAGGIFPAIIGTFYLTVGTALFSVPLGIAAAAYLAEYAKDTRWTRLIRIAIVNLAGIPSVVYGLFGFGLFVIFLHFGTSILAASLTLSIMTLPVIITSTREALASVPMTFREACWNLGATRWQTIRTVVLPNSISGILTGVILQVSRAAGETAPILFTGAVFFVPVADHGWASFFPYGLGDRCMALSMHLFTLSTQVQGVSPDIQYGTAVVLIGLVLLVNSVSIALRFYLRLRKKW